MKRTTIAMLLTIVAAISLQAASLTGKTWYSSLSTEEGNETSLSLEFNKDGGLVIIVVGSLTVPIEYEGSTVNLLVNYQMMTGGTYKRNGDVISYHYSKKNAQVQYDLDLPGINDKRKAEALSNYKKKVDSKYREMLVDIYEEIMPESGTLKINSLYDDALELENDIDSYQFEALED